MKSDIKDVLEIPEGIQVKLEKGTFEVIGEKGTIKKRMENPKIKVEVKGNSIGFNVKKSTQREKKVVNAYKAHLKNMFHGVKEGYVYKLKICASHFPMNVSIDNNQLIIKNFIGEKTPRKLKIKEGGNVKIDGVEITVEGTDKELVGQIAADIENVTKRPGFDKRIFQDGIYIIEKAGKIIK
jgi:large subunit ribosomal protein L6